MITYRIARYVDSAPIRKGIKSLDNAIRIAQAHTDDTHHTHTITSTDARTFIMIRPNAPIERVNLYAHAGQYDAEPRNPTRWNSSKVSDLRSRDNDA